MKSYKINLKGNANATDLEAILEAESIDEATKIVFMYFCQKPFFCTDIVDKKAEKQLESYKLLKGKYTLESCKIQEL